MMNNVLRPIARRAYQRLPERWRRALDARLLTHRYRTNTDGLAADVEAERWFAQHGRPVSIVIPSYNDLPLLREAVASIRRTCADVDYEIIVVDDYIDPAVQKELENLRARDLQVILKTERLGFSGTVNVGMQAAAHDIVLLNSDIVAQDGWLMALQRSAYDIDPRIGLVSPKMTYPDGRIQYAGTYYARLLAPQWFGHLHVGSSATKPTANVPGYNVSISGACVYITRTAYERLGPLDDGFWLGFEDVDYGLRAWANGIRCYYEPRALLTHHESASRGYSQGHRELSSMRRFWGRWGDRFLTRHRAEPVTTDIVLGAAPIPMWHEYARELGSALSDAGHDVAVHHADVLDRSAPPDEGLIEALCSRDGVLVATDWTVAETTWLAAAAGSGIPAYLVPAMESGQHPHDPALQAEIVAGYRSDFDLIAPNRHVQRQLQAETAWESRARIAPALTPPPLNETEPSGGIATIGASASERRQVDTLASEVGVHAVHHDDPADRPRLQELAAESARVVIDFVRRPNSLSPYALMSIGAAYVAPRNEELRHEVLDGYNALLFDAGSEQSLRRSVIDALDHPQILSELRVNGHASAARAAAEARGAFIDAIHDLARSSVG
ncbi:MAG: glycosyltransferase family 2 protein [Microbacterium sp.]|uniref:glycosyltransferase n=1 Tax=Microbacterium sp. TaxID=51671 RepID=UPI0039E6E434